MENRNFVYVVEVHFESIAPYGITTNGHEVIAIYEDVDDAIDIVLNNADKDVDKDQLLDAIEDEGWCDVWWHPMELNNGMFTDHIHATITEMVLNKKTNEA